MWTPPWTAYRRRPRHRRRWTVRRRCATRWGRHPHHRVKDHDGVAALEGQRPHGGDRDEDGEQHREESQPQPSRRAGPGVSEAYLGYQRHRSASHAGPVLTRHPAGHTWCHGPPDGSCSCAGAPRSYRRFCGHSSAPRSLRPSGVSSAGGRSCSHRRGCGRAGVGATAGAEAVSPQAHRSSRTAA